MYRAYAVLPQKKLVLSTNLRQAFRRAAGKVPWTGGHPSHHQHPGLVRHILSVGYGIDPRHIN